MVHVTMAPMMSVMLVAVGDHDDRPMHDHRTRMWIDVDDARRVRHDHRWTGGRSNLTTTVAGLVLIDRDADQCAGGRPNNGALGPAIIVMTADQSSRHCPQHRRLANDRRPINFRLRGTNSDRRK